MQIFSTGPKRSASTPKTHFCVAGEKMKIGINSLNELSVAYEKRKASHHVARHRRISEISALGNAGHTYIKIVVIIFGIFCWVVTQR